MSIQNFDDIGAVRGFIFALPLSMIFWGIVIWIVI